MSNLIPEGSYTARAVGEVQYGVTKSGGDYVRLSLSVQAGEGQRIMSRDLFFTEKTAERSVESLRHLGWTGNELNLLAVGTDGLGDRDASVDVEHEDYTYTPEGESEQRTVRVAKITWINAAGGAKVFAPMGEGQRKAFGARFKALAMKVKPTAAPAGTKPAASAQRPANGRPAPASDMPPIDWEPGMDD